MSSVYAGSCCMQYGWNIKVSEVHLGFMKASPGLRKQADELPRV